MTISISLKTPFAFESVDEIELIGEDEGDVIEQLETRRAAVAEVDALLVNETDDKMGRQLNSKLLKDNNTVAMETNNNLLVLVKNILQNVKEVGYANENIEAIRINNTHARELLRGYSALYTCDKFKVIVEKLANLSSNVETEKLSGMLDLNTLTVLCSMSTVHGSIAYTEYSASEFFNLLNSRVEEVGGFFHSAMETMDAHEEHDDGSIVTEWRDLDIGDLVDNTAIEFTKYITEVAMALNESIIKAYEVCIAIESISVEVTDVGLEYNEICREVEATYLVRKIEAVEHYYDELLSLESFRDNGLGRALARSYSAFKAVITGAITGVFVAITSILSGIPNMVAKVNEVIEKAKINSKLKYLQKAPDIFFGFSGGDGENNYVMISDLDGKVHYYRVNPGTFGASLSELDMGKPENVELKKKIDRYGLTKVNIGTIDEMASKLDLTYRVPGIILPGYIAADFAMDLDKLLHDYRDAINIYLRNGKMDMMIRTISGIANVMLDAQPHFNSNIDSKETIDSSKQIITMLEQGKKIKGLHKGCSEEDFIKGAGELDNICKDVLKNNIIGTYMYNDIDKMESKAIDVLTSKGKSIPSSANKTLADIEKMINEFELDEKNKIRAEVARAAFIYLQAPLRNMLEYTRNTVVAISARYKTLARANMIVIRVVEKIYDSLPEEYKK
jgi:hypothetical protein